MLNIFKDIKNWLAFVLLVSTGCVNHYDRGYSTLAPSAGNQVSYSPNHQAMLSAQQSDQQQPVSQPANDSRNVSRNVSERRKTETVTVRGQSDGIGGYKVRPTSPQNDPTVRTQQTETYRPYNTSGQNSQTVRNTNTVGYQSTPYTSPNINSFNQNPSASSNTVPVNSAAGRTAFQPITTPNIPPAQNNNGPLILPPPAENIEGFLDPIEPIDLEARISETQTGRIMFGVGLNSDAGVFGQAVIDEQNFDWRRWPHSFAEVVDGRAFRGGGQRLRLEAQPGTVVQRYAINWTDPYFRHTPVSLGLSAFFYNRRFFDWDEERVGGRVSLGYQFRNDWSITGAARLENVDIFDPRIVPAVPEIARALGKNDLYSGRVSLTHDTRNSAFIPSRGHLFEVAGEYVLGDFEYPRATIEGRQYFTVYENIQGSGRHIIAASLKVGVSGSDTPVYDNFFAGGFSTMRGFSFRGASPLSPGTDVTVGGQFQFLGSVEYSVPLVASEMLRAVAFVDYGTVEEDIQFNADDFRVAPGFGLRIATPAFGPAPIALDFAFPIAMEDGDRRRVFTFNIGLAR